MSDEEKSKSASGQADESAMEVAVREIKYALKQGEVQKARHLLSGLASEIVIQTTSLPRATYPQAIEAVAALIDQGKADEAKAALQAVFGTLVVSDRAVIALPVECASAMRKDTKKQLEMAEPLGYGRRKKDFEGIYT